MAEINTRYLVSNLTQQSYSKGVGVEATVIGEQGLLRNKLATHNNTMQRLFAKRT